MKTVSELVNERERLIKEREQVNVQMNEIADRVSAQHREMNDEEKSQYNALSSKFEALGRAVALNREQMEYVQNHPAQRRSDNDMLREALRSQKNREFVLAREGAVIDTTTLTDGGLVPLTIKDVLLPLEEGLIFDKVGIPVQTGVVGNIQWPVLGAVEASVQGESAKLDETGVDMSKIAAVQRRLGIRAKISNQAINNSAVDLKSLLATQLSMGMIRLLNRLTFSHENLDGDIHGPWANAKATGTFAGSVPTFKELLKLKGAVAKTGVDMRGFCYVMSEELKAELESTSRDAGSGRMIIENGTIAGYPVFCTEFVNYGKDGKSATQQFVAAGCFAYLAANQHGDIRMIVDPYTAAAEDSVIITLNSDWSLTTLRKEAFALWGTKAEA